MMPSWLLFIVHILILWDDTNAFHHSHPKKHPHDLAAHRDIDDRIRHQEEIDLFGFDIEEEFPLSFGDNQMKIGKDPENVGGYKKSGDTIMSKTLTQITVYSYIVDESEKVSTKQAKKDLMVQFYTSWDGAKPAENTEIGPNIKIDYKTLKQLWDVKNAWIDKLWWSSKFMANKIGTVQWGGNDPKKKHGFGAKVTRAIRMYCNDHGNNIGKMVRRLFYNYNLWRPRMSDTIFNGFRKYAAELYEGTHSSGWYGGPKAIMKYLKDSVVSQNTRYRQDNNYLYVYHGTSADPLNSINQDWNPQATDRWWGPTSSSLDYSLLSGYANHGIGFEIKIPWDPDTWEKDFGLAAALLVSSKNEDEILLWNVPTKWMTPISTLGKFFIRTYPAECVRIVLKRDRLRNDAVADMNALYTVQNVFKNNW